MRPETTTRCGRVWDDYLVGVAGRIRINAETMTMAIPAPSTCMATKGGTELGAMPENVLENMRPMVTAGLANAVELVNQ